MYYAKENQVGTADALPAGAIEITEAQYNEALDRMIGGEAVKVANGALDFYVPEQPGIVYLTDADGYYTHQTRNPPEGSTYLVNAPSEGLLRPKAVNGIWVEGAEPEVVLADAKQKKTDEINDAAETEIVSGVVSDALGSPHTYDTELEDQINLLGTERKAALTGQPQPYKCAGEDGIKAFRMHTPEQLQQVLDDGAAMKLTILQKAATLKLQAAAATTEAELALIVW